MEYAGLLGDGRRVPMLGLGCYQSDEKAIRQALKMGYRHLDTANFYENEKDVGKAVKGSGIERKDLFVVSKIWPTSFSTPEKAIEYSLKALGVEYIDAYLLHWPGVETSLRYHAWEALLEYRYKGFFKHIGVSNFKEKHLKGLIDKFNVVPAMNQIEISPWNPNTQLLKYCQQKGIVVTACVPFAKGEIFKEATLHELSAKYGKSMGQIILRWNIQRGNCVIPKSSCAQRIAENFNIFDFSLEEEDMRRVSKLENGTAFCSDSVGFTGDFWHIEDRLV